MKNISRKKNLLNSSLIKDSSSGERPSEIKERFQESGSETGLETTTGIQHSDSLLRLDLRRKSLTHSELHPPSACEVQSALRLGLNKVA